MKKTPRAKTREISRRKSILSVRERQFQIGVKVFKEIVEFRSAHLSIFETEVHVLQHKALRALIDMENVQRQKPLISAAAKRHVIDREFITRVSGRFASGSILGEDD